MIKDFDIFGNKIDENLHFSQEIEYNSIKYKLSNFLNISILNEDVTLFEIKDIFYYTNIPYFVVQKYVCGEFNTNYQSYHLENVQLISEENNFNLHLCVTIN